MVQESGYNGNKILQTYIREAKKYHLLTRDSEKKLILQVKAGSHQAVNALVRANLLFVVKIAYKYRNQGMDLSDLISAGNLGLIEAAHRMDPEKDNKFITYAVWWIRQSIRHAIFNQSRLIRLASNKEEKVRLLYRQSIPTRSYIGGYAIDFEKAKKIMGDQAEDLINLMQLLEPPVSFDAPRGEDEKTTLLDTLADHELTPDQHFQEKERNQILEEAKQFLDGRENKVLENYFGLEENQHLSLAQIGENINLSKERVRQIKDEALEKLKNIILKKECV